MSIYGQVESLKEQALREFKEKNYDRGLQLAHEALNCAKNDSEFVLSALLHLQSQLAEAFAVEGLNKESRDLDADIGGCLQELSDEEDQTALEVALENRRNRANAPARPVVPQRGEPPYTHEIPGQLVFQPQVRPAVEPLVNISSLSGPARSNHDDVATNSTLTFSQRDKILHAVPFWLETQNQMQNPYDSAPEGNSEPGKSSYNGVVSTEHILSAMIAPSDPCTSEPLPQKPV